MRGDKRVFLTLDGLRGIAAIMIVLFHSPALVGHLRPQSAYLSVDLFFALSGCVLEASYRDRLAAGLSTREFMLIRCIRLWPMFALSLLVGLAFALVRLWHGVGDETPWGIAAALLTGLVLLPTPAMSGKGWVVPLNAAGWSLILELVVNLLYARFWRHLTNRLLSGIVVAAGLALMAMSTHHGGIDMGSTWGSIAGGLVRVTYSFALGVLILRAYDGRVWTGWASAIPPLALIPILAMNRGGLWFDLVAALVLLPLIVWAGLRLEPGPWLGKLFRWGGLVSYALYALHGPVLKFARLEIVRHVEHSREAFLIAGLLVIAALLPICALLDRWYDAPLRRRLNATLLRPRERSIAEPAMSLP
ncbi:acyltransferase family protein [Sphingomonas oryzagri]